MPARCDACSVRCLFRWDACIGASECCLASGPPGTGFRRGREVTFVTRRLSRAVYAHKRSAWIARWGEVRRSSGIPRCCIPNRVGSLATYDQKHLPSWHDRAPRFPRRVYAHKLSGSQPRLPPSNDRAVHAARESTRYSHRRRHTQRDRVAHRPRRHPPHHPIKSSAIVASFMRINR